MVSDLGEKLLGRMNVFAGLCFFSVGLLGCVGVLVLLFQLRRLEITPFHSPEFK